MRLLRLLPSLLLGPWLLAADAPAKEPASKASPEARRFEQSGLTHGLDYLVYLPKDYAASKDKTWPLVVFLHGSGERGNLLNAVRKNGLPSELDRRGPAPYILIAPQCPAGTRWNIDVLDALLSQLLKDLRADPKRVIVTGLSLGGMGSWEWASAHPERFAGMIPVCGKIAPEKVSSLKGMPIWAFHGDQDNAVKLADHQAAVDAARRAGADIQFTVYPGVGHNSWVKAYAEPELEGWILARVKK